MHRKILFPDIIEKRPVNGKINLTFAALGTGPGGFCIMKKIASFLVVLAFSLIVSCRKDRRGDDIPANPAREPADSACGCSVPSAVLDTLPRGNPDNLSVYVCGAVLSPSSTSWGGNYNAALWVDGTRRILTEDSGKRLSQARSLAVSASSVAVCGQSDNRAALWLGSGAGWDTVVLGPDESDALGICFRDGGVLVCGYVFEGWQTRACVWEYAGGAVRASLLCDDCSLAYDIYVRNSQVCVSGEVYDEDFRVALVLWEDGEQVEISDFVDDGSYVNSIPELADFGLGYIRRRCAVLSGLDAVSFAAGNAFGALSQRPGGPETASQLRVGSYVMSMDPERGPLPDLQSEKSSLWDTADDIIVGDIATCPNAGGCSDIFCTFAEDSFITCRTTASRILLHCRMRSG